MVLIQASMLFSVRGGRKSKQMWGYFPSATDGQKSMQTLFSVRADGNLCAPSAIFYPQGWKTEQMWGYFSSALTKKETIWWCFPSTMDVWKFWLIKN